MLDVLQVMLPQTEEELLETLKGDDAALAATAEAMLWRTWCRSGNVEADRIFRAGVDAMQLGKLEEAAAKFSRVIEIVPEFAEGWNKRATVRFMRKDFAGSIGDCQETLARNPHHFGALSGQGLCHISLGEYREAAVCFRRALQIHPISMGYVTTWRSRKPKAVAADTFISQGLHQHFLPRRRFRICARSKQ